MLAKRYLGVHAGKSEVASIILPRLYAVEKLVVPCNQRFPPVCIFPEPIAERILYDLLFLLRERGFLRVQHSLFVAVSILNLVVYADVAQIQRVFEYLVRVHAARAVGAVSVHIVRAHSALAFDTPLAGDVRIVHLDALRRPKRGLKRLADELPDVPRLNPRRTEPHVNF